MSMMCYLMLSTFFACPLPPEENSNSANTANRVATNPAGNKGGNSGGGPGGNTGGNKGGQGNSSAGPSGGRQFSGQNGQGNSGGGPSGNPSGSVGQGGAPGGILMDMNAMSPQNTQDNIKSGDAISISGTIKGECSGLLRIDAIDTSVLGAPKEGEGVPGPITSLAMEGAGAFEIFVPKGSSIQLTALCDNNRDNKITESDDLLSLGSRVGEVQEAVTDIELTLESIKPPSESEGPGGPGAGGPGAANP
jgi:hypothetical protein